MGGISLLLCGYISFRLTTCMRLTVQTSLNVLSQGHESLLCPQGRGMCSAQGRINKIVICLDTTRNHNLVVGFKA